LERLQKFINNPSLIILFAHYLNVNGLERVRESGNMMKHEEAYYEAFDVMIS
jgi:hypothetical protein